MNSDHPIKKLPEWYFFNKREFPWRTQIYTDRHLWAYHTWICEVMSQQTGISVVIPKFKKFITELPNVEALANCSDELLRSLWSGLGYYARARNLRKGAHYILSEYNGQFPTTQKEWMKIPGCGDYTSSIIASICFSEVVPAIDGNMIRVASRLLGLTEHVWDKLGQQEIARFMQKLMRDYFLPHTTNENKYSHFLPGDFNQAFMDLGSTICKKTKPLCEICPLQSSCSAYKNNIINVCPPVKPRKNTQQEQVHAFVFLNKNDHSYLLVERKKGFLSQTMGFPLFAMKDGHSLSSLLKKVQGSEGIIKTFEHTFNHKITHHNITGVVTLLENQWNKHTNFNLSEIFSLSENQLWVPFMELKKHLSSSLDLKVLKILS